MAASEQLPMAQRLAGMTAGIRALIAEAEVRLFGSRARGEACADADVDLLITATDAWLAGQDRFALLAEQWGAVAQPDLSVDLVLHSSGEAARGVGITELLPLRRCTQAEALIEQVEAQFG